jgi:periplasmic protein TonB
MISRKARLRIRRGITGGTWLLILGTLGYLVYLAANGTAIPRRVTPDVAMVHLEHVLPPPPPPPPPPVKQRFVEQARTRVSEAKPMEASRPEEKPAAPAPQNPQSPELAAKGAGAPDAFGLTGNPNGGDYIGGSGGEGTGAGPGGSDAFGWYARLLESRLTELLRRESRLRGVRYRVLVQVWLTADGLVQRVEYISSSGKTDIDRTIQQVVQRMSKLPEPPPKDLPQPIVLRLDSSTG